MNKPKVVITDYYYESIHQEAAVMAEIGAELRDYHCQTEDEVIAAAAGCDALICQFAPITRKVIESLDKCKVIVRYAIGVDNIDVAAAEERGIYVCNVPDYETHPVHRAFRRCHAVSGSLLVGHIQQLRQSASGSGGDASSAEQPVTIKLGWAETAERSGTHCLKQPTHSKNRWRRSPTAPSPWTCTPPLSWATPPLC